MGQSPTAASAAPLISCVMATGGRPRLLAQALDCFRSQTYPRRELIVVDAGPDAPKELPSANSDIRYLRLDRPATLGAKLNAGLAIALGSVFQKLDDDDYYAPSFLETAQAALAAAGEERIVVWDSFLILRAGEDRLRSSGPGWRCGATLCFPRAIWERTPFRDAPRGVDRFFLDDSGAKLLRVSAPELCVVLRHDANTWQRTRKGRDVDEILAGKPFWEGTLDSVVGERAAAFYRSLSAAT